LENFVGYVEDTYFAFARQALKPSTVAGYFGCWKAYIRPRVQNYALRDFTTAIVAGLLKDIARAHSVNTDTVAKLRSVLCAIFSFAISEGHFPAKSASENPARGARIPGELTSEPTATVAASREQVRALLSAVKDLPLERAAIALMALTGARPNEVRGMRWDEWDRANQHIAIKRGVWHSIIGTTKTEQSQGFVAVTDELRQILQNLWEHQNRPIAGFILAGPRKNKPVVLDNMAKRSIRHRLDEVNKDAETKLEWPGWYALRRFHATQICKQADGETAANALRNSKEVAKNHYIKPDTVLPKTRKAVNDAVSGLVQ
jgi:integrase